MALDELDDPRAVLAAVDEFDQLGRDEFLGRHGFGPARRYLLNGLQASSFPISTADFHAVLALLGEDPTALPAPAAPQPRNLADLADPSGAIYAAPGETAPGAHDRTRPDWRPRQAAQRLPVPDL